jgi:hypothetical protein
MPNDHAMDPRAVLVREKYFSLRPKPLERWLWQQNLPQAAERVFWLHWEEGMRRGDWCSEFALKQVARECCIDVSTVTRAYQVLKVRDLVRREDPGRDPHNPFQQAIAITEVRLPRELLITLGRFPNRPARQAAGKGVRPAPITAPADRITIACESLPPAPRPAISRQEAADLMQRLSTSERTEYFLASRDRRTVMAFDLDTALGPEERGRVLELLARLSNARPEVSPSPSPPDVCPKSLTAPRRLSPLEAARVRKSILQCAPAASGQELFRQVLWSMEEGALRRFDPVHAANIALKKIREGMWSRPHRMPPNWLKAASPETCSAA